MNINSISDTILDESSSSQALRHALDTFSRMCGQVTHVRPDPGFDAWAEDSLLENGVAINPEAAAHCAADYARSVAFIRGIYAGINTLRLRFPDTPIDILYAGCGPFATLVLPLLGKFCPGELNLCLLDYHQRSLDSVTRLLANFGFSSHSVQTVRADACHYEHPVKLHLVIAEVMQKSLEQEPQFAVTANLAPQLLPQGIFIPQEIDVSVCLADLAHERELLWHSKSDDWKAVKASARRYLLGSACTLVGKYALGQLQWAQAHADGGVLELQPTIIEIPEMRAFAGFDIALFTRIQVFQQYRLEDYEAQITLPTKCYELMPLVGGERYRLSYQLGGYPKFHFERLNGH